MTLKLEPIPLAIIGALVMADSARSMFREGVRVSTAGPLLAALGVLAVASYMKRKRLEYLPASGLAVLLVLGAVVLVELVSQVIVGGALYPWLLIGLLAAYVCAVALRKNHRAPA